MKNPMETWRATRPFQEMQKWQTDLDRLFEDLTPQWSRTEAAANIALFNPSCDIREDKTNYYFSLDMPGMAKDQIKVELDHNVLTVSAERRQEKRREGEKQFQSEIYYGSYLRSFRLPVAVDEKKVEAHYENGVLAISIPKLEASGARKINVH